jgi:hypothetical protein
MAHLEYEGKQPDSLGEVAGIVKKVQAEDLVVRLDALV